MGRLPNKKPAMTYFVVQRVGSLLILFGGLIASHPATTLSLVGLLVKIGLVPVHYWVPLVVGRLSFANLGLLLTWQKVAPLRLMRYLSVSCAALAVLNAGVGAALMLKVSTLRPLLAFRGLVQMG